MLLRGAWARLLHHTPLWRLVDRVMPARLTILAGHCVADEAANGGLPADMKISAARLERIAATLGQRHGWVTVGEGVEHLDSGSGPRSMVALSMDDGYKDNRTVLLPLLERSGARATVFLESRPLEERRVNWSHKYFWLLANGKSADEVGRDYLLRCEDAQTRERLRRVLEEGGDLAYTVKRVFKYEAARADRDARIDELFREHGGDEAALCERIYMDWDDVRALAAGGVELGGHTVHHEVLATLDAEAATEEVARGRDVLVRELGEGAGRTFAYPFGRRWDFDDAAAGAVRESGFAGAVTTHAGTCVAGSDRMRLARWMIDEQTPLHLITAEACGGFALLRRIGLDLSE
ncbi:MAG: polysaccharide deacetylase family protein [bacterium]|nr:polysaccharide deacetylase family protein [bacterium]